MFPPKSPGEIEAEVLMTRTVHKGSFLLVEGPDDLKFWRPRILDGKCELVDTQGKPNLLGAVGRLDTRGFTGMLGVIDDDGDSLDDDWRCPSRNLVVTDARDIECMLLRSPALERGVLAELGNPEKIDRFQQQSGVSVRERLLENGLAFGRLRWLSKRQGWGLDFGKLKPEREPFLSRETWRVDETVLLREAASLQGAASADDLRALLDALPPADPWCVCQGHDLVEILRLGLLKVLGDLKPSHGKDQVASLLRAAFHDAHLAATRLCADVRGWEHANVPYRVLAGAV
jgi:hypothetical protein